MSNKLKLKVWTWITFYFRSIVVIYRDNMLKTSGSNCGSGMFRETNSWMYNGTVSIWLTAAELCILAYLDPVCSGLLVLLAINRLQWFWTPTPEFIVPETPGMLSPCEPAVFLSCEGFKVTAPPCPRPYLALLSRSTTIMNTRASLVCWHVVFIFVVAAGPSFMLSDKLLPVES